MFRGKMKNGKRFEGIITGEGGKRAEHHRRTVARTVKIITGKAPAVVSDADLIEAVFWGVDDAGVERGVAKAFETDSK